MIELLTAEQRASAPSSALIDDAWRRGDLLWKLDDHQLDTDALFERWNARRQTPEYAAAVVASGATLDDVWVEEVARRFGKTAKWIIRWFMAAIKRPGAVLTYGTAFQKDIGEIIVPLAELLSADAPADCKPRYQGSKGEQHQGLYFPIDGPASGSMIKLVGVDMHPNALRGRFSDGVVLSECGFMRGLENLVRAVLLPQFQRRPWAYLVLETSTPEEPLHDFMRVMVPDAKLRDAYVTRTIEANLVLSDADKAKYIRQAGGRGHPICEREYFCEIKADPERSVIPEFDPAKHVKPPAPVPEYAHCYTAADPAIKDMFALVFAYWDVERQKMVVRKSWAERNAGTNYVAGVIRNIEHELWFETSAYDRETKTLKPAPHARVSDTDLRLIFDLSSDYGLFFVPTLKDDKDAQVYALRDAFLNDLIEIEEGSGPLADHVRAARWNDQRSDFERSPVFGHYDALDALIYLWRYVSGMRNLNPRPPIVHSPDVFVPPAMRARESQTLHAALMPQRRGR